TVARCWYFSFVQSSGAHPGLRPFPTRRSSDLSVGVQQLALQVEGAALGAVNGITYDGVADMGHVDPDLVGAAGLQAAFQEGEVADRKSTRLNSSHVKISYAVFCLKKKRRVFTA